MNAYATEVNAIIHDGSGFWKLNALYEAANWISRVERDWRLSTVSKTVCKLLSQAGWMSTFKDECVKANTTVAVADAEADSDTDQHSMSREEFA